MTSEPASSDAESPSFTGPFVRTPKDWESEGLWPWPSEGFFTTGQPAGADLSLMVEEGPMLELQRWLYAEARTLLKSFANGIAPLTLLTGISIAALFGLVHAFMPGHGKTVLVSYFLGRPSK